MRRWASIWNENRAFFLCTALRASYLDLPLLCQEIFVRLHNGPAANALRYSFQFSLNVFCYSPDHLLLKGYVLQFFSGDNIWK